MDTTAPNRTGAVWVAGTGAFLLLAAAALFVAVRWDQLPDAAKLGVVGALTGAFLLGGRSLARTLPATGDVLFHLGALLIPVDVGAVSVRLRLGWRGLLLAEGLAAGGALAALAAASGSVVLTWAAAAAPVTLAAGVAAVSPVPAPLLLAFAALAATATRNPTARRLAMAWATVAGLAPMFGAVAAGLLRPGSQAGVGVLSELGLAGRTAGWAALASGALAAIVLGREAKAREDGARAGLAVAIFVAGAVTAGVAADLSDSSAGLTLAGSFVAIEAAALVCRRDRFWGPVVAGAAFVAEVPALVVGWTTALFCFAFAPLTNNLELFGQEFGPRPVLGVTLGLLAVGWFVMGARRLPAGEDGSLFRSVRAAAGQYAWLVAPAAGAAAAQGTASGPVTAAALVALGALLATAPQRGARLTAGVVALMAPLVTFQRPWAALPAGLAGATVATLAARKAHRLAEAADAAPAAAAADAASQPGRPVDTPVYDLIGRGTGWMADHLRAAGFEPVLLTLAAVGAAILAWVAGPDDGGTILGSLLAVGACFGVAAALEPAQLLPGLARSGAVLAAIAVVSDDPERALPALALATALAVADAVGRDRPLIALGAAATVQLVIVDLARQGGLDTAATGLALCVAAVVWAGLALVADQRWRLPLLAAAGAGLAVGLSLAGDDPRAGANALLITGGLAAAAGIAVRRPAVVGVGAAIVCLAIGTHLEISDVRASDAYLAPVAALLLGAGFHVRRSGDGPPSSWVAYTPAVALLGGAALVERIAGGGGVHALVAGAVGIAAVAAGGGRRLAGPLFTGTALLVAVTVHESLATLATIPTWGWLAAGGSLLLALGVGLERQGGTGPVEAGRRLVDVVAERFS